MAYWLGDWIPDLGIPGSKPLGGCKVSSAFRPSGVSQMSTRNSRGHTSKKKLSPCSGSVAWRHLNATHKKGP